MHTRRITGLVAALVLAMAFVAVKSELQSTASNEVTVAASQTDHDGHAHDAVDQPPEPNGHHDENGDEHAHDEGDPNHGHEDHKGLVEPPAHDEHDAHDEHHEHGEGVAVQISDKGAAEFNLKVATAGPGKLQTQTSLPGEIVLNEDRRAHIVPQAPGIVRKVEKSLGDTVHVGEVMAFLESAELGEAKVQYLAKWAEVGCCKLEFTRAQEVSENTQKLLETLESSPSLDTLRDFDGAAMGDNRSRLVTAYADYAFAGAAYLRAKPLFEKGIASEEDFLMTESALKKADAQYSATRDAIEYEVRRNLLEAQREQQVHLIELKGAERRLYILGLTAEDIEELEKLAQRQTSSAGEIAACTDPNCTDCRQHTVGTGQGAGADHHEADEKLAWYALRAPFDGTVIEKHITLGERLTTDANAFTIADLSSVWVDISVPPKDLAHIKNGAEVSISAGQGFPDAQGTIAYVAPIIAGQTRTAWARVVLPNPEGHWRPGLFVTARISVAEEDVSVLVPKTALQTIDDETVVFVPTGEGFQPSPVSLGRSDRDHVEVLSGLRAGDDYVADGSFVLKARLVTSGLDPHAGHGH